MKRWAPTSTHFGLEGHRKFGRNSAFSHATSGKGQNLAFDVVLDVTAWAHSSIHRAKSATTCGRAGHSVIKKKKSTEKKNVGNYKKKYNFGLNFRIKELK